MQCLFRIMEPHAGRRPLRSWCPVQCAELDVTEVRPPMRVEARYPSLAGKRVLVTGGASGIGRCIVDAFAIQGAAVACIDVDADALADVATGAAAVAVATHRCDLTDRASARATIAATLADGAIDILVNNAGRDDRHAWDRVDDDYWDRCLAINLDQQFFCTRLVAPPMVARRSGVIVNLGSVAWMRGRPAMVGCRV
jgi:NAD(P)-dependent dehydrogenase (short-subunit alcohol dehydrogenase family)